MTLNIVSSFNGVSDPDAAAYIEAVEAADGELLEFAVGKAINDFVLGCKADGIWDAIKASCILAGARTLDGALVPLTGAAPTNYNFVAGDYNRKTGLRDASNATKYLDTNKTVLSSPINNKHLSAFTTELFTSPANETLIGGFDVNGDHVDFGLNGTQFNIRLSSTSSANPSLSAATGLYAVRRSDANNITYRQNQTSVTTALSVNQGSVAIPIRVFSMGGAGGRFYTGRLAFYSIGESLDLALLDARVTDLITAFGAAIP